MSAGPTFVPVTPGLLLPRDYHHAVFSKPCPTCGAPAMHHCALGYARDESVLAAHPERHVPYDVWTSARL